MLVELLMAVAIAETPDRTEPLLECPAEPTGSWVVLHDHRRALAFVAAVRKSSIEMSEGRPFDCGLELLALCVPDLDGDGVPDLVVRAGWESGIRTISTTRTASNSRAVTTRSSLAPVRPIRRSS